MNMYSLAQTSDIMRCVRDKIGCDEVRIAYRSIGLQVEAIWYSDKIIKVAYMMSKFELEEAINQDAIIAEIIEYCKTRYQMALNGSIDNESTFP